MLLNKGKDKRKTIAIITILVLAAVLSWLILKPAESVNPAGESGEKDQQANSSEGNALETPPANLENKGSGVIVQGTINVQPAIEYKNLEKDESLKTMMDSRKEGLGIQESLDMIVKSDESFIVGGSKISMREILEKAFTKSGDVYQEEILPSGETVPGKIKEYGIHVVRPGDNVWNIHFNILKDYYSHRSIQVGSKADEPGNLGFSSGVGKILKFSETMVIIYNLIEKKIAADLGLLEPLSKVVVYNMEEVFTLLEEINYENVDRIQFDGKNIWIPAKKS
jgi:hypothetical protein